MSPEKAAEAPLNPGLIFDMLQAHQRTAALKTAIELDLFRAVGQGPGDVASIARHCSASERGIRILCDYLVINGILLKEDKHYRHTPLSATFLDPASPASMASMSKFIADKAVIATYEQLTEIVRSGRTVLPGEGSVEPNNPIWVEFAESMAPMMAPVAAPFGALVLEKCGSGPVHVLDIAAGHGLFGIAIARQNAQARITALDWEAVLGVAEKNAAKAGVSERFSKLAGSAFDVAYGGPYDAVLLTNFLHHFDHPTCVSLLKKVHAALRPGGYAATLEFVPDEGRVSPPTPAAFAMTMLASTPAGDAYTLAELTAMYGEAGFKDVSGHPIPMSQHTAVLGKA
jgi:2-polyprenyl-3-methyl-5-hydroxy-6-metoxy-1,4-benzoquinol methylase